MRPRILLLHVSVLDLGAMLGFDCVISIPSSGHSSRHHVVGQDVLCLIMIDLFKHGSSGLTVKEGPYQERPPLCPFRL